MTSRDPDYTVKMAELAIGQIKALTLPADPPGFELWYTYATGQNQDLNRRINDALHQTGSLSLDRLQEISNQFLPLPRAQNVNIKVSKEIDKVAEMLNELTLAATNGRENCASASMRLAGPVNQETVRTVAAALTQSLRSIEEQTAHLEQALTTSRQELLSLQKDLASISVEAKIDSVTGLLNRRSFDTALEAAIHDATTHVRPLSLLMIDIDHFKSFNDRFGHLIGDHVLVLMGKTLKQTIKGQDIAARYGGEEFSVILPSTDLSGAVGLAEQIRKGIMSRELRRRSNGESLGTITVSIGAAEFRSGEAPKKLIARADAHLYQAKRTGRNCVRFGNDPNLKDAAA